MAECSVLDGCQFPVPSIERSAPKILVFDSGLGGLSVFREVVRLRPDARFAYAADDAGFPYGGWSDGALMARVCRVMDALVDEVRPDLVVVACGTASTLTLPALRARHTVAFVGTVPAIKPACASSRSRQISVLATPGTVRRDYTASLIRDFAASCTVTLVASEKLAGFVEDILHGHPVTDGDLRDEIAPCFVEGSSGVTDTVVLACTHYPLVLDRLARLAPWPVQWVDPAPAIARRVGTLLDARVGARSLERDPTPVQLLSTGAPLDGALISAWIGRSVMTPRVLSTPFAEAS